VIADRLNCEGNRLRAAVTSNGLDASIAKSRFGFQVKFQRLLFGIKVVYRPIGQSHLGGGYRMAHPGQVWVQSICCLASPLLVWLRFGLAVAPECVLTGRAERIPGLVMNHRLRLARSDHGDERKFGLAEIVHLLQPIEVYERIGEAIGSIQRKRKQPPRPLLREATCSLPFSVAFAEVQTELKMSLPWPSASWMSDSLQFFASEVLAARAGGTCIRLPSCFANSR
jgi:hypothetical protein